MNRSCLTALALVLVVLCAAPRLGRAEAPVPPDKKTNGGATEPQPPPHAVIEPQTNDRPGNESPSGPAPYPHLLDQTVLGLTITQIAVLGALAMVFIFTAMLMRWWLSEPAAKEEEEESPPAPGPQDAPQ
jgi:hypothetical protein